MTAWEATVAQVQLFAKFEKICKKDLKLTNFNLFKI